DHDECAWSSPKSEQPFNDDWRTAKLRSQYVRGMDRPLVVRFRSSYRIAARTFTSFGIRDHWQLYDSSAPLNPKFAIALAATRSRASGSGHQPANGEIDASAETRRRDRDGPTLHGCPIS